MMGLGINFSPCSGGNFMSKIEKIIGANIGRALIYIILDAICIDFSILVGIGMWFDGTLPGASKMGIPPTVWSWYFIIVVIAPVVCWFFYAVFKFYNSLWEYAAIEDFFRIVIANTLIFLSIFCLDYFIIAEDGFFALPKRIIVTACFFNIVLMALTRFGGRMVKRISNYIGHILSRKAGCKRVMIIGAGKSGNEVIKKISNNEPQYEDRIPVIVVDDDKEKNNSNINGVRVVYGTNSIARLARMYDIDEIIIAIPTATNIQLRRIIDHCTKTECALKKIQPISDISDGVINNSIMDINIADLLSRDEINIDVKSISGYLKHKTVLVTGGGGSIGSELCRQISKFSPSRLVIFDIYENSAFELFNELTKQHPNTEFIVKIGSVRDEICLEKLFKEFQPAAVFHAAAHKHVCLMENCPEEAVKNNVFGTLNVAKLADKYNVERFVLLSTDKAVNPTNVMGATKRITELIIQDMASKSKTKFMAVRFGNVLGSNGSVIPIFQKQIENGGPVTVTDPNVVRFFMTIPEAARLVLQAGGIGESGRIFVLDMGEPVKINDLAKNLIRLSGYIPNKDIDIVYTGLRAGEKLYEELIMDDEKDDLTVTYHNKIFITKPVEINYQEFEEQLKDLYNAAFERPSEVYQILHQIVPNFK